MRRTTLAARELDARQALVLTQVGGEQHLAGVGGGDAALLTVDGEADGVERRNRLLRLLLPVGDRKLRVLAHDRLALEDNRHRRGHEPPCAPHPLGDAGGKSEGEHRD